VATANRLGKTVGSYGSDTVTSSIVHATDVAALNMAAEKSGRTWRLSTLEPHGWQLVHVAGKGTMLEIPDARTEFEAVKRAVGFLLAWGRL
jgi:hypothetical protein